MKIIPRFARIGLAAIALLSANSCSLIDPFDGNDPRSPSFQGKPQTEPTIQSSSVPSEWFYQNLPVISNISGIPNPELIDLYEEGKIILRGQFLEIARYNCIDCNGLVTITLEDLH